ncbi:MAG: hypothetical protein AB2385_10370 [Symbiobacterium sp.]|uniref:hypothetical protein n=1 Tax=Symbiobacterium sp. TaxID=1971213 RepID=UPI003464B654
MTWILLFLGVLGIAWLMYAPRPERETRIPMAERPTADRTGVEAVRDRTTAGMDVARRRITADPGGVRGWIPADPRVAQNPTEADAGIGRDRPAPDADAVRPALAGAAAPETHPAYAYDVGAHATGAEPESPAPRMETYATAADVEMALDGDDYGPAALDQGELTSDAAGAADGIAGDTASYRHEPELGASAGEGAARQGDWLPEDGRQRTGDDLHDHA